MIFDAGTSNRGAIRSNSVVRPPRGEAVDATGAFGLLCAENLRVATCLQTTGLLHEHRTACSPTRLNIISSIINIPSVKLLSKRLGCPSSYGRQYKISMQTNQTLSPQTTLFPKLPSRHRRHRSTLLQSLQFELIRRKSRHSVKMSTLTRTFRNLWRIGFKVRLLMSLQFLAIGRTNLFSRNMDIKCRYVSAIGNDLGFDDGVEAHVRICGK